jgi:hypothetical protein
MTEERIRRVGENEALYRQVNEQVRGINEGISATSGTFDILCECGTLECMEHIPVTPQVYEQTRSESDRFIMLRGHHVGEIEEVIADHGSFYVIEKKPPEAKQFADETDPRT